MADENNVIETLPETVVTGEAPAEEKGAIRSFFEAVAGFFTAPLDNLFKSREEREKDRAERQAEREAEKTEKQIDKAERKIERAADEAQGLTGRERLSEGINASGAELMHSGKEIRLNESGDALEVYKSGFMGLAEGKYIEISDRRYDGIGDAIKNTLEGKGYEVDGKDVYGTKTIQSLREAGIDLNGFTLADVDALPWKQTLEQSRTENRFGYNPKKDYADPDIFAGVTVRLSEDRTNLETNMAENSTNLEEGFRPLTRFNPVDRELVTSIQTILVEDKKYNISIDGIAGDETAHTLDRSGVDLKNGFTVEGLQKDGLNNPQTPELKDKVKDALPKDEAGTLAVRDSEQVAPATRGEVEAVEKSI